GPGLHHQLVGPEGRGLYDRLPAVVAHVPHGPARPLAGPAASVARPVRRPGPPALLGPVHVVAVPEVGGRDQPRLADHGLGPGQPAPGTWSDGGNRPCGPRPATTPCACWAGCGRRGWRRWPPTPPS